ncbi:HNH endonuclease [Arthrobacter sp. TMS1-12-1]
MPDAVPEGYEESLVSRIRAIEDLKSVLAADQARAALALDTARRRTEAAAGVPADQRGRGVGAEIALARRESPHQGSRLLGFARTLLNDMPHTLAALESGRLNEWRTTVVVRETVCLSAENRQAVDTELAADTGALEGVGTQGLKNRTRKIAYRLEPEAAVARARKAVGERHVSCRPAPDTMAYLTALLPAAEAIGAYSALSRHADTQVSTGESHGRGRGQLMADAFVDRLTGSPAGAVQAEVQLIMTDRTLLQGDSEPAYLPGYGCVPAQYARDLIRGGLDTCGTARRNAAGRRNTVPGTAAPSNTTTVPGSDGARETGDSAARVWLRRLYTAPDTGQLVAMESRARLFPPGLRRLIAARDATCRTPYCDAPIRHSDHIIPWRLSGTTNADGGQGLCESCNYIKESLGWSSHPLPGPRHAIERRTPTGHSYVSEAPPLPGAPPPGRTRPGRALRPVHSVVDLIIHPAAA